MTIDLLSIGEPTTAARSAAGAAGVDVRELAGMRELEGAVDLLARIWGRAENPPVPSELLRAFSKAGNYVAGAFAGDRLVGATVAFHASPEHHSLHSHIAGVDPAFGGRAIGFAMKLHQRAWALGRGIRVVEWTFDPLVSRNAHFNIAKLGAHPVEYLDDFYGEMNDVINAGDETDRILLRWVLDDPSVIEAAATGHAPIAAVGPIDYVAVPPDVEALRRVDPLATRDWRRALRAGLAERMRAGDAIVGFDRARGYMLPARKEAGR